VLVALPLRHHHSNSSQKAYYLRISVRSKGVEVTNIGVTTIVVTNVTRTRVVVSDIVFARIAKTDIASGLVSAGIGDASSLAGDVHITRALVTSASLAGQGVV